MEWFLNQNVSYQKVVETAGDPRMHLKPTTWSHVATAVKCVYLIVFAPIVVTIKVEKSSPLKKRKRSKTTSRVNHGLFT